MAEVKTVRVFDSGYNFSDAMELARAGYRVRRGAWPETWWFVAQHPEGGFRLTEARPDDEDPEVFREHEVDFVARQAELEATDWQVVGEVAAPGPPGGGAHNGGEPAETLAPPASPAAVRIAPGEVTELPPRTATEAAILAAPAGQPVFTGVDMAAEGGDRTVERILDAPPAGEPGAEGAGGAE